MIVRMPCRVISSNPDSLKVRRKCRSGRIIFRCLSGRLNCQITAVLEQHHFQVASLLITCRTIIISFQQFICCLLRWNLSKIQIDTSKDRRVIIHMCLSQSIIRIFFYSICCFIHISTHSGSNLLLAFACAIYRIIILVICSNRCNNRNSLCILDCNLFVTIFCCSAFCQNLCLRTEFHLIVFQLSVDRNQRILDICRPFSFIRLWLWVVASIPLFIIRLHSDIQIQLIATFRSQSCHKYIVRITYKVLTSIMCIPVIILNSGNCRIQIQCSLVIFNVFVRDTFKIQIHISVTQIISVSVYSCIIT